jgi:hypothetical protein
VKGRQGTNGTALATALPAMSPFPLLHLFRSLAAISVLPDPSSDRVSQPHDSMGPLEGASWRVLRPAYQASRPPKASKV